MRLITHKTYYKNSQGSYDLVLIKSNKDNTYSEGQVIYNVQRAERQHGKYQGTGLNKDMAVSP